MLNVLEVLQYNFIIWDNYPWIMFCGYSGSQCSSYIVHVVQHRQIGHQLESMLILACGTHYSKGERQRHVT